jgi:transposase
MISKEKKAVLHVAKSQLHLDDDTYRDLLASVAGVRSSNDLTDVLFDRVMKHFEKKLGFTSTAKRRRREKRKKADSNVVRLKTEAQLAKIQDNYRRLGFDTIARQHGFNRRQCGKAEPVTLGDCERIIEGQKAILGRPVPAPGNDHAVTEDVR